MQVIKKSNRRYCTTREELKDFFFSEIRKVKERIVVGENKSLLAIYSRVSVSSLIFIKDDKRVAIKESVGLVVTGDYQGTQVIVNERAFDMATKVTLPKDIDVCSIENAIEDFIEKQSAGLADKIVEECKTSEIWVVDYVILHNNLIEGYICG